MKDTNFLQLITEEKAAVQVLDMNHFSQKFGLEITMQDAKMLVQDRKQNLREQQRVEFGEGIMQKLIYAFCDSPFLSQDSYVETLEELQSIFYLYKNETEDLLSDDELIEEMEKLFNGKCQGSLKYLAGTCLAEYAKKIRIQYSKQKLHYAKVSVQEVKMKYSKLYSQEELLTITHRLTDHYTSKESSSVPYERARQLMGAVVYCIEYYYMEDEKKGETYLPQTTERRKAEFAYEQGYQKILKKASFVKEQYQKIAMQFQSFGNRVYEEMFYKELPQFFIWYDARYSPQCSGISLAYPLLGRENKKQGIQEMAYIMDAIACEQLFLQKIPYEIGKEILQSWHTDYEEQQENVCLIILRNLLCHFLMQKQLDAEVSSEDYAKIRNLYQKHSMEEMNKILESALKKLIDTQYDSNEEVFLYLKQGIADITAELKIAAEQRTLQGW